MKWSRFYYLNLFQMINELKFIKSQSPFMLWGVNCNKSHQPLNVSMPLNISCVHPQLTGDHNIQHKIRLICFRCLRESREVQLLYNFCFRRSLRKSTLSSIQRTEINWFASRTSSHGRYWICYNIPVNGMQQTYICVNFMWPVCWHHNIYGIYRSHYWVEASLSTGRGWLMTCGLSTSVWRNASNSWRRRWRRSTEWESWWVLSSKMRGELKGWDAFLNWHSVSYCDLKHFRQGSTQNECGRCFN